MFNVDNIIQKTDLRDLVEKAGGHIDKGRSACPIHGGSDQSGFSIFQEDGKDKWVCFSGDCGSGDVIDFVRAWRGWDFKQACEFLGGDVQANPTEMKVLADERLARAERELYEKRLRHEAALKELRVAERHVFYHANMGQWAIQMWIGRGLDEGMQDFFTLGGCDDFVINEGHHTPSLTIPIFDEKREVLNIKHRLVSPQKPTDKYRPERSGLGTFPPLLAIPEMGYDGQTIIVVEGEIKAMVVWATISEPDWQVIGVPGRNHFDKIAEKLFGKNVIVIPDKGAEKEAYQLAKFVKGKFLRLPDKVDDFILSNNIKADDFYALTKQARRVA